MVAVFILLIVAVGILAGFGYTVFNFQRAAEIASMTQRNATRMETVASIMRSASAPLAVGGPTRVPAGDTVGSGRTGLPIKIVGDNLTPWGAPYGYCPMGAASTADSGGNSSGTVNDGGSNYTIRTFENRGILYVTDGSAATAPQPMGGATLPAGLLGLVVSPAVNQYDIPRCDEIIYRDKTFLVGLDANNDGQPERPTYPGTVFPIIESTSSLALMSSDLDPTIYVSTGGTAAATGGSAADPMSLAQATTYWNTVRPTNLTIIMANGTYPLAGVLLKYDQADLAGKATGDRHIRFTDNTPKDPAVGATLTATASTDFDFRIGATLEGITLGPGVGVKASPGSEVRIENSVIRELRVDGGKVVIGSTSVVNQDTVRTVRNPPVSPITVYSGELTIAERSTSPMVISSHQTNIAGIRGYGGEINIQAAMSFPNSPLPWFMSGSANINLGETKGIDWSAAGGGTPASTRITRAQGYQTAILPNASAPITLEYSCNKMQPYVVNASCSATSGTLASSALTDIPLSSTVHHGVQKWTCTWAGSVSGPTPVTYSNPNGISMALACSTSPP